MFVQRETNSLPEHFFKPSSISFLSLFFSPLPNSHKSTELFPSSLPPSLVRRRKRERERD